MNELDEATLKTYLPDGPISSLRRIEAMYGAISEADAVAERGGDPGEFGLYFTPRELDEFVSTSDDDRYLTTVRVDLTGDVPRLVDVDARRLTEEDVDTLGFSRYPWGRGIDNSITRRGAKGGSDASTVTRYCIECLRRWTNGTGKEGAIGDIAETHPDGWVIDGLRSLGMREGTEERIEEILDNEYPKGSPRVVATVAVQVDEDRLDYPPEGTPDSGGYYYPGQLHVLNDGMRARKEEKLARKNLPDSADPSRGEAACMVTGDQGTVFGTTEDPLAFFTVQHAEKFPNFSKSDSWRSHSVSSEAALLLQSGTSLLERCSDTRGGLRVYTIPYFRSMNLERAEELFKAISSGAVSMSEAYEYITESPLSTDIEDGELRFYVIGVRNDSGDINVLFEIPNADVYWPTRVARSHARVVDSDQSTTFSPVAGFASNDDWRGISSTVGTNTYVEWITNGLYAHDTMPESDSDAPVADDAGEWLTRSLLTGEPVNADRLLDEFVSRIEDERRDDQQVGNHVLSQYAQLETLAHAELLDAPTDRPELTRPPQMMTETHPNKTTKTAATDGGVDSPETISAKDIDPDGDPSKTDARRYRLRRFLDERATLRDNDERRGAFLAGALVGQLGDHQSTPEEYGGRGMNRTIRDRCPPEQMTGGRLKQLYTGDLERLPRVYGRELGTGPLFPETRNELRDTFADAMPDDWTLPVSDLRFFYALGVEYGSSASYQANQLLSQVGISTGDTDEPAASGQS